MSLPGAFSDCKRFWGVQLINERTSSGEMNVRVKSDTKLHISKAIVDFGPVFGYAPHKDNCSVSIGVRYETDGCDCDVAKQSCSLHPQKEQSCVLCIIKPGQKCEADLDLNFVGGKNLTFCYSCYCADNKCPYLVSVNISGYEVRG